MIHYFNALSRLSITSSFWLLMGLLTQPTLAQQTNITPSNNATITTEATIRSQNQGSKTEPTTTSFLSKVTQPIGRGEHLLFTIWTIISYFLAYILVKEALVKEALAKEGLIAETKEEHLKVMGYVLAILMSGLHPYATYLRICDAQLTIWAYLFLLPIASLPLLAILGNVLIIDINIFVALEPCKWIAIGTSSFTTLLLAYFDTATAPSKSLLIKDQKEVTIEKDEKKSYFFHQPIKRLPYIKYMLFTWLTFISSTLYNMHINIIIVMPLFLLLSYTAYLRLWDGEASFISYLLVTCSTLLVASQFSYFIVLEKNLNQLKLNNKQEYKKAMSRLVKFTLIALAIYFLIHLIPLFYSTQQKKELVTAAEEEQRSLLIAKDIGTNMK